ncbi:MAG: hypothetical protein H6Q70_1900 [Firmicutes bacterium]|nr:hypothetical protein [Bacillota bacterium]
MQNITVQLLIVFIVSGLLKIIVSMIFGSGTVALVGGILIDIAVLGIIYVLMQNYRFLNIRKMMMLISGITFVSILVDLGILRGDIGNLLVLAVLGWMMFGNNGFFGGNGSRRIR